MIYVSSGHEQSISLEVFLKGFVSLTPPEQKQFQLVVEKQHLLHHLDLLGWSYRISDNLLSLSAGKLKLIPSKQVNSAAPPSSSALLTAMSKCQASDILLTMPTSKDQLIYDQISFAGHTELFRHYHQNRNIGMMFAAENNHTLLLTDHIPLKDVASTITTDLVINKISLVINQYFKRYNRELESVVIAGINPHSGESGILGNEDDVIQESISIIKNNFPEVEFIGPLSGDTLHLFNSSGKNNTLYVYSYHDQGLPFFKARYGTLGVNISIGMPYTRVSVDHGTAFDLYGKNRAFMLGTLYLLKFALKLQDARHE